jgi:hypothetical protein
MHLIALFFTGVFLCNALPHLCAGLQGRPFPSPFAKPSGVGDSSPLVNVLWGFLNLLAGLLLLAFHPVALGLNPGLAALVLGALTLGTHCALHFGKVQAAKVGK